MESMISKSDKRHFLTKLLETTPFKARSYVGILSKMLKTFDLNRLHVVTDVTGVSTSMTLPTLESEGASEFVYNSTVCDIETWMLSVLVNSIDDGDVYVKIDLAETSAMYPLMLSVLETNSAVVEEMSLVVNDEIDMLLTKAVVDSELGRLVGQIDAALDAKDAELFTSLTTRYAELTEENARLEEMMRAESSDVSRKDS